MSDPDFTPTHIVTLNGIDVPVSMALTPDALADPEDASMLLLQAAVTAVESFTNADAVVKVIATGETESFTAGDIRDWWA